MQKALLLGKPQTRVLYVYFGFIFRPRSASVSRLDDKTGDLREFVDLPNGKPLTERRRISQRNSEAELTNMFGPGHELSIFVGTWNLNLSTNVDPGMNHDS